MKRINWALKHQTLWYLNTLHFGIRGGSEEHRQICLGDIKLKHDFVLEQSLEYHKRATEEHSQICLRDIKLKHDFVLEQSLEYHERATKMRTGEDIHVCPPVMYATPENQDRYLHVLSVKAARGLLLP